PDRMACLGCGRRGPGVVPRSGLALGLDRGRICNAGGIAMRSLCFLGIAALLMVGVCAAQNLNDIVRQGEQIFAKTCATGYCHGVKGGPAGAPRLAGRRFDQAYIANVVTRGVPGTGMASFATTLSRPDLVAVIAYVATLNGITEPN